MLHLLRRAAKTWVFRILFVLLIASFAFWGLDDLSFGGAGSRVAQVGDKRVSVDDFGMALSREMRSLQSRAGRPIPMDEAREMGIPDALLARIIRDAALDEEARALGLSADDAALRRAILESPSFQGLDGRFDDQQYRFVLNQLGFRVDRFEEDLRRSLAREAVALGVAAGARAAPGFADRLAARDLERRVLSAIVLPMDAVPPPPDPDETVLRAFHAENAAAYEAPESRSVVWVEILPEALAETLSIPEDDLRDAYAAARDRFDRPERRTLDRIVFRDEADAEAARDAIARGESDFPALAASRGLSEADIALGDLAREALGPYRDEVFGAGLGVVGPVRTTLGPALYNVRAVLPARVTPFEAAREELAREVAVARAADAALEMAERVADLLASGASIEGIASETGLPLRREAALTRDGGEGLAGAEALIAEAFAARPAEERDVIETGDGAFALLRVDAITPAAPLPFDAAAERVAADWRARETEAALRARAEDGLARLEAGADPSVVAAELNAQVEPLPPLRRGDAEMLFEPDAVNGLFDAPVPGAAAIVVLGGEVALLKLTEIRAADPSDPQVAAELDQLRASLDGGVGADLYAYYAAAVQARMRPTVNTAAVEQVVNALR